jgi:hypothetical protein
MENVPKVIYKGGFLRIVLPDGTMLPETNLTFDSPVDQQDHCLVTVQFLAKLDLKE